MAAILDFQHTQMSNSIPISLSVLSDLENMGIAVGNSLLKCIEAEIYVISFLLPINDHHLRFPTYPDAGQYSYQSLCVA